MASSARQSRTRTFEDLLAVYPPGVRTLARRTRAVIREVLGKVEETVDGSGPFVGYGDGSGYADLICTIIVSRTGVKLGIVRGSTLADPNGLLEGRGKTHRYIAVNAVGDLRRPGVRSLLRAARRRRETPGRVDADPDA